MIVSDLPFTWIGIRSTGISAWILLTAVVIIGLLLRTRLLGGAAAPQGLLLLHRYVATLAIIFLSVHMGLLVLDPVVKFAIPQLFIPFLSAWKPTEVAFGVVAFWLLIPVLILGAVRARLGKQGNIWFKRAHIAAYFAWPLATLHFVLAGTDALTWWALTALISGSGVVVFLLLSRGYVPKPKRAVQPKVELKK